MTKAELAEKYTISKSTLQKLLNERYFEKLKKVGYKKQMRILPTKVVREFFNIYGEPLNTKDYE